MRLVRYLLALAAVALVHIAGVRLSPIVPLLVDPILVLILYHSLESPRGWDIVGASVAGLVHDALTGGVYGQLGLVDTVTAYVCSRSRQHLVLLRSWRLGLFFSLLALLQQALLAAVRFLLLDGVEIMPWWSVAAKMVTTGVLGAMTIAVGGGLARRAKRRRREHRRKPTLGTSR